MALQTEPQVKNKQLKIISYLLFSGHFDIHREDIFNYKFEMERREIVYISFIKNDLIHINLKIECDQRHYCREKRR